MSELTTLTESKYSYKVNNKYALSVTPEYSVTFIIISDNNISFILTPNEIYNAFYNQIFDYNVTVQNLSNTTISNFDISLVSSDSLTYISGSLVNTFTGMYYPCISWKENYCHIGSILPNEILNLKYSLKVIPSSDYYITNPFINFNTTSVSNVQSNNSFLYIYEQKINISYSPDSRLISIENTGTKTSNPFTLRHLIPYGTVYSGAFLNGIPYNDISHSKLGNYEILKIGFLPISSLSSRKILKIFFYNSKK